MSTDYICLDGMDDFGVGGESGGTQAWMNTCERSFTNNKVLDIFLCPITLKIIPRPLPSFILDK